MGECVKLQLQRVERRPQCALHSLYLHLLHAYDYLLLFYAHEFQ